MPQAIDYAALAKQAGAVASAPPPTIDYTALAAQAAGPHEPDTYRGGFLKSIRQTGRETGVAALNALPGAGAIVGGVLATPETAGAGTLAGAALGAGVGRGLRDLIAEGFGLEAPTSPTSKGGRIALDTAETAIVQGALQHVVPGLWTAMKTPGKTVSELVDTLPQRLLGTDLRDYIKAALPKGIGKAPASVLQRPAWQSWSDHLPEPAAAPPTPTGTGTSMRPAAMPAARPVGSPPTAAPAPVAAGPAAVVDEFTAARSAKASAARQPGAGTLPDQKALNEAALAERRAAYQATQREAPAPLPPAGPVVKESGKMQLTAPEMKEFSRLLKRGLSLEDSLTAVKSARQLAAQLGGATDAQVAAAVAHRGATGAW